MIFANKKKRYARTQKDHNAFKNLKYYLMNKSATINIKEIANLASIYDKSMATKDCKRYIAAVNGYLDGRTPFPNRLLHFMSKN